MTKVVAETGGGFAIGAILIEMVAHSVRHQTSKYYRPPAMSGRRKNQCYVNRFTELDGERKLRRYMGMYFSNQLPVASGERVE